MQSGLMATNKKIREWVHMASPGERLIYYRGLTPTDDEKREVNKKTKRAKTTDLGAAFSEVHAAYLGGLVEPFQRCMALTPTQGSKTRLHIFEYSITRISPQARENLDNVNFAGLHRREMRKIAETTGDD